MMLPWIHRPGGLDRRLSSASASTDKRASTPARNSLPQEEFREPRPPPIKRASASGDDAGAPGRCSSRGAGNGTHGVIDFARDRAPTHTAQTRHEVSRSDRIAASLRQEVQPMVYRGPGRWRSRGTFVLLCLLAAWFLVGISGGGAGHRAQRRTKTADDAGHRRLQKKNVTAGATKNKEKHVSRHKKPQGEHKLRMKRWLAAAICYTGGFRTFEQTFTQQQERLVSSFPTSHVFMFISLQDTYKPMLGNFTRSHSMQEFDVVRRALNPVVVRTYTLEEADMNQTGVRCLKNPTFTNQLWTIRECFSMIWRYEQDANLTYAWVIRTRPDIIPNANLPQFIESRVLQVIDPKAKIGWRKFNGSGSDLLMIMTRAAARPYGLAYDSLYLKEDCGFSNASSWSGSCNASVPRIVCRCQAAFPRGEVFAPSPPCILFQAWTKAGVKVEFNDRVSGALVRR